MEPIATLSVEELVSQDIRNGERLHERKGIWWREVKPFYYIPAWFFTAATPGRDGPNPLKALSYSHMVPAGSPSNGQTVVNVMDNLGGYSLDNVAHAKTRYNIRHGLKNVEIRAARLDDLLSDGYKVYLSWRGRMGEALLAKDRSEPGVFRDWITRECSLDKRVILGAFAEGKLVAFMKGYAVDGTATVATVFSLTEAHHLHPIDALLYTFIMRCRENPSIYRVVHGLKSANATLQTFKARHGFREESYPTYISMNRLVRLVAKSFLPEQYRRLMGAREA